MSTPRHIYWLAFMVIAGVDALHSAPGNDNRAAATNLGTALPALVSSDNYDATMEPGELNPGNRAGSSVWFRWTCPADGWVRMHTLSNNSSFYNLDTVIAVYEGSSMLGYNDEEGTTVGPSSLTFHAKAGTVYEIGIYGYDYGSIVGEDPFQLRIESTEQPDIWVADVSHSPNPVYVNSQSQDVVFEVKVLSADPLFTGNSTQAVLTAVSPNGTSTEQSTFQASNIIWGNTSYGRYATALNVLQNSPAGPWAVEISLTAPDGKVFRWSPQGPDLLEDHHLLKNSSIGRMTVSSSIVTDTLAPTLASFTVSPSLSPVTLEEVVLTTRVQDLGGSGFATGTFQLSKAGAAEPIPVQTFDSQNRISGNASDGTYRITYEIPYGMESGEYHWTLTLVDGQGNSISYFGEGNASSILFNARLTVTSLPSLQAWRNEWFDTLENTGDAADDLDPDGDGHSNFLEFATGKSPTGANSAPASLVEASPEGLIFDYDRSKLAHQSGYSFHVEWNDSLTGPWQTTGVTQSLHADQGSVETIRAVIPAPTGGKRFVRLRVNAPQ